MKKKLTKLIVSRYYRGLNETVIAKKYKFVVVEHVESIELCRYDNKKNPDYAREPINIELENPVERALSECSYQMCDLELSDKDMEEIERLQEETYNLCMETLKAEAGVGYNEDDKKNERHFLSLYYVDCSGRYDGAQYDVFIKGVDRNFLTFVEYSFNITDERCRERIQQAVHEHVQLVNEVIKSKDVEFLRLLIENSQKHKRVGVLSGCSKKLDTFENIMQYMSCVSKKYDKFSAIFVN